MDPTELPSSSKRVSDGDEEPEVTHEKFDQSTGEGTFRRLDVEMIDQLSTLDVLCPRVQWILRCRFRQGKVQYNMNLESVLGAISATLRHQAWCSFDQKMWQQHECQFLKSLTRNVQFCLCTKAAAMAR